MGFLLFLGLGFSLPYMTLQMMSLGLTLADASPINGLGPIVGFLLTPILGYAGDKLGYKLVLIVNIILFCATTTSLNFLPVYRQHQAKIGLSRELFNNSAETFPTNSILWFGKYGQVTDSCEYEEAENKITEVDCDGTVFNVDIQIKAGDIQAINVDVCDDLDVQTCKYVVQDIIEEDHVIC